MTKNERIALIKAKDNICEECGLDAKVDWNGKKIIFQIHEHRTKNPRLLCPNCHSQTDDFTGRKRKGKKVSEETRLRMAELRKTNPQYFSESHRQNLSKAMKELYKNKENHPMYGKTISLEARQKMSKAKKGKIFSEEHRQNISKSHIGKKFSEEHKRNLSLSKS